MGLWINGEYAPTHFSQYDPNDPRANEACVPAAIRNGADASTAGKVSKTVLAVHRLVPKSKETNPLVPGWSLEDGDLAAARMGVGFEVRSSTGRTGVRDALNDNLYVVIQGDSDRFGNSTCSGAFNGPHCIGWNPITKVVDHVRYWWINDGICPVGRWEKESVLWAYAEKLNPRIRFGAFTRPVLQIPDSATSDNRILIKRGAKIRIYHKFCKPAAGSKNARIDMSEGSGKSYTDEVWNHPNSSAPCGKAVSRTTCDGRSSATTTLVTGGKYTGHHLRVRPEDGTTVV